MGTSVETWSTWEAAGGRRESWLYPVVSVTFSAALDGSDEAVVRVPEALAANAPVGKVLRVVTATGDVTEYRVRQRRRVLGAAVRELRGFSVRDELGRAGVITQTVAGVQRIDVAGSYTVTEWLTVVILPFLAAKGYSYFVVGTIDATAPVEVPASANGYTPLSLLKLLAERTGHELRVRRVGGTQVAIDLLAEIGAGATMPRVQSGRNLIDAAETEEDDGRVSAVMPLGDTVDGVRAGLGENAWVVGTIPGSAPYWVPLTAPDGAAPPIQFDGQFGVTAPAQPAALLLKNGTTLVVQDSRAIDSAVLLSATTGLVAGDLVQVVADTSGTRLVELTNPLIAVRNAKGGDFTGRGERNVIRNGLFTEWSGLTALSRWTKGASVSWVAKYPRTATNTIAANGTWLSSTSLGITGAPPNFLFLQGDIISLNGSGAYTVSAPVQMDGTGAGTLTMASLPSSWAGTRAVAFIAANPRPSALPDDGIASQGFAVRAEYPNTTPTWPPTGAGNTAIGLLSESFTVKYVPGLSAVYAATAWSYKATAATRDTNSRNVDASSAATDDPALVAYRHLPGMAIRKASTVAAYAVASPNIPALGEAHFNLACQTTITADTVIDLVAYPSSSGSAYGASILRYAMVWLGSATVPPPTGDAARGNALWQWSNRELVARALGVRSITLSLRDLAAALGYIPSAESLVLGGRLLVVDMGITVRIVAIWYDLHDAGNVKVTLDSRPASLVRYLAERTT